MEEFEKWLSDKYPQHKQGSWGKWFGEDVWKAALEWVKNNSDKFFESDKHGYYYDVPANIIDDELGE